MIQTDFFVAKDGTLLGYQLKGHSGLAPSGEDIVCAAVSSSAYLVANTITDVLHIHANIFVDEAELLVRVTQKDAPLCRDLLAGFKLHLLSLEEQYPENIYVNYTEV